MRNYQAERILRELGRQQRENRRAAALAAQVMGHRCSSPPSPASGRSDNSAAGLTPRAATSSVAPVRDSRLDKSSIASASSAPTGAPRGESSNPFTTSPGGESARTPAPSSVIESASNPPLRVLSPIIAEHSEGNKTEQNETKCNVFEFSPIVEAAAQTAEVASSAAQSLTSRQRTAINLLVLGSSAGKAAAAVQVSRTTMFRWRRDPKFAEELSRRMREVFDTAANRLRLTVLKSLKTLDRWIEDGGEEGARFALRLLGQVNARALLAPPALEKEDGDEDETESARDAEDEIAAMTAPEREAMLASAKKMEEGLAL